MYISRSNNLLCHPERSGAGKRKGERNRPQPPHSRTPQGRQQAGSPRGRGKPVHHYPRRMHKVTPTFRTSPPCHPREGRHSPTESPTDKGNTVHPHPPPKKKHPPRKASAFRGGLSFPIFPNATYCASVSSVYSAAYSSGIASAAATSSSRRERIDRLTFCFSSSMSMMRASTT